jgi:hypothetical protein
MTRSRRSYISKYYLSHYYNARRIEVSINIAPY